MPIDVPILVGAGVVVLAVIAAVSYVSARTKAVRGGHALITETEHGFKRVLTTTKFLWNPEEHVLKGPRAPSLGFVTRDPVSDGWVERRLLHERTGDIDLRVQICSPRQFRAKSKDAHHFLIQARVNFKLDRDRLEHAYHIQDFSAALESRILSAFRSEIGKFNNEEVREKGAEINAAVSQALNAMERPSDAEGPGVLPLGVIFYDASFEDIEITPQESRAIASGASRPAGDGGEPGRPSAATSALSAAPPSSAPGAMGYTPQLLDDIADVFRDRDEIATEALLAMLEMQTRQNIAEALRQSGGVVVLTPEELGLAGGSAVREKISTLLESVRQRASQRANGDAGEHETEAE